MKVPNLLACLLMVCVLLTSTPAVGQRFDPVLDLARGAVHEAGFDVTEDEIAAIWAVARLRHPRAHSPVRVQMRRFFSGRTRRSFLLGLGRNDRMPVGWPSSAVWANYSDRWLAVLNIAERVVAGEISHRCEFEPVGWGGPRVDRHYLERVGRDRWVNCGETRNVFFTWPVN